LCLIAVVMIMDIYLSASPSFAQRSQSVRSKGTLELMRSPAAVARKQELKRATSSVRIPTTPPANDKFVDAQPLQGTGTIIGHNFNATGEPPIGEEQIITKRSVWFRWTAPASDSLALFDTVGSQFDTVLYVFSGDALNNLLLVTANDDTSSLQSFVTFVPNPGESYYLMLDGYFFENGDAEQGYYYLRYETRPPPEFPEMRSR
jgi:hypothetical protein